MSKQLFIPNPLLYSHSKEEEHPFKHSKTTHNGLSLPSNAALCEGSIRKSSKTQSIKYSRLVLCQLVSIVCLTANDILCISGKESPHVVPTKTRIKIHPFCLRCNAMLHSSLQLVLLHVSLCPSMVVNPPRTDLPNWINSD